MAKKKTSFRSSTLALTVFAAAAVRAYGANCSRCDNLRAELKEQNQAREKETELFSQNQAYLTQLSARDASKLIKVESNLGIIQKQLDQIKIETDRVSRELDQEGCQSCQKPTVPPSRRDG